MCKKKIFGLTAGHPINIIDTTGHLNNSITVTESMKNDLITKIKTCIEDNTVKNNIIYDIVDSIKQTQHDNK